MKAKNESTNRLIHSASPYLMQHAYNPVDWYEWGDEAWDKAKIEDKPVLISIGYSACHWCHVMAHECFEDNETAEIMNQWFVNIKVDREERPDVDLVYMDACQAMTGRGGWPLNVICTPDGKPIYAGTYFLQESWQQILIQIKTLWETDRSKIVEYGNSMQLEMEKMASIEPVRQNVFSRKQVLELFDTIAQTFDFKEGGPNRSPKFPMPNNYEFLLDHYLVTGNAACLDFVHLSLLKMSNGGIYDPIRGGFCRYSTDAHWFAPHFEKMLYDNAQLMGLYARAFAITDAPVYKEITEDIIAFCMRELRMENGGYFSALDADSDGMEGRFYVFTDEELRSSLTPEEYAFACIFYGCKPNGNWEHNFNILYKPLAPLQILEKTGLTAAAYLLQIATIKKKLFEEQNKRNRPGLDTKIITSWNGLMLEGLAKSAKYTNSKTYLIEAQRLADWIWNHLQCEGKLWRIYAKEKASIDAFSEDYACLITGLIALFEADQNFDWLNKAAILVDTCIAEFYDKEKNTFYFTSHKSQALIVRKTDINDDVISSSNSMLCIGLQKLGILLDRNDVIQIGEQLLSSVYNQVNQYPGWFSNWAKAEQMQGIGIIQAECTGPNAIENSKYLSKALPSWAVYAFAENNSALPLLKNKINPNKNQIFICLGTTCFEPVSTAENALEIIQDILAKSN